MTALHYVRSSSVEKEGGANITMPTAPNTRHVFTVKFLPSVTSTIVFVIVCGIIALEMNRCFWDQSTRHELLELRQRMTRLENVFLSTEMEDETPRKSRTPRSASEPLSTEDLLSILEDPTSSRQDAVLYTTVLRDGKHEPTAASTSVLSSSDLVDDVLRAANPSIQSHHREKSRHGQASTKQDKYPEGVQDGDPVGRHDPEDDELQRPSRVQSSDHQTTPREFNRRAQTAIVREAVGDSPRILRESLYAFRRPSKRKLSSSRRQMMQRMSRLEAEVNKGRDLTAGHFEAAVSQATHGHLGHYKGNGRLQNNNPSGLHADWRMAGWMSEGGYSGHFTLYGGMVTVKKTGLYYLYAQINYVGRHPVSGFEVQVNAQGRIQCVVSDGGVHQGKVSTCATAAVVRLNTGDTITINDLELQRTAIMTPQRSYFGLFKISGSDC